MKNKLSTLAVAVLCCAALAPTITSAAPLNTNKLTTTIISLTGRTSYVQKVGSKPVKIKDNLRITGNIQLRTGKTVDGVDVSALSDSLLLCKLLWPL